MTIVSGQFQSCSVASAYVRTGRDKLLDYVSLSICNGTSERCIVIRVNICTGNE